MTADLPEHLRRWPGLYEWRDGRVVEAAAEDAAVAKAYPHFPDKGPIVDGVRLTIMSRRSDYPERRAIRIIHVVEALEPGLALSPVGPKPVFGEYVDGLLATPPPPADLDLLTYNGPVLPAPSVDYNYEITSHVLSAGVHEIQWRIGKYVSNTLKISGVP